MPTFEVSPRFWRDFERLSPEARAALRKAIERFVQDLRVGRFRKGLRVKGIKGAPGVFEMTFAPDGRATFEFGLPLREEQPHVVWRRCGTHAVLGAP